MAQQPPADFAQRRRGRLAGRPRLRLALGGATLAAACATNPVTGDREFVAISEAQEISIGREADVEIRSQMGVYADEDLQAYVEEVGRALAAASHRPDLDWHFAVVDSPAVNAFALPGGYIYLTRGIMAHLNDEAELAGVLGHEIAHVTARHSVQAYSRAFGANLGLLAAQIFVPAMRSPYGGPGLGDAAGNGLGLLMLKFGRDDERQADRLGAEYSAASGWDPHGVGDMLSTLARIAETSDRRGVPNWLSTHPEPADRVVEAAATVDRLLADVDLSALRVARAVYLDRVDGLVYGDNPEDGVVRGRDFLHPELRFAVTFPEGWEVRNSPTAVVARQPGRDNYLLLTLAEDPAGELQRIAEREMLAAGYRMQQGTPTSINGLDAYVGTWTGAGREREPAIAHVAYIRSGRSVYVLGGFAPADEFTYVDREVHESIRSFRALGRDEAEAIRPNRIAIYEVRDGDTWQGIAQRAGQGMVLASTLAILNGYPVYEQPSAGDVIKIVMPGLTATRSQSAAAGAFPITRRAPSHRRAQYDPLSRSTRTTPRSEGAWTNSSSPSASPTWDGPGAIVVKKTRSPACTSSRSTRAPTRYWSAACRGSRTPCRPYTYRVNPLQSNPAGLSPPQTYGTPRRERAVPVRR